MTDSENTYENPTPAATNHRTEVTSPPAAIEAAAYQRVLRAKIESLEAKIAELENEITFLKMVVNKHGWG